MFTTERFSGTMLPKSVGVDYEKNTCCTVVQTNQEQKIHNSLLLLESDKSLSSQVLGDSEAQTSK